MPPIPAIVSLYGPALLALAVALACVALCRAKTRQRWLRPGLALACLLGWIALEPLARLGPALLRSLAPLPGPAILIVPGAALVAIETLRTLRAGRNDRLLSFAAAATVGWWLARGQAGPGEGWRVAIVVAGLTGLVALLVRAQPGRALALALSLWGSAWLLGFPSNWTVAAAVMAAAAAAPLALRAGAGVPSAAIAALLAATDLARGRLAQGHLTPADLACLLSLAAPLLAAVLEPRLGKKWAPVAPVLAAALAVAAAWGLRRALHF